MNFTPLLPKDDQKTISTAADNATTSSVKTDISPTMTILTLRPLLKTSQKATAFTMTDSPASRRSSFFDLPPELRNIIYQLSFTTLADAQGPVPLSTHPPSKELILVNKQFAQEAKAMYKIAYRRFWSTTHFHAQPCTQQEVNDLIHHLRDEDLKAISKLTIPCWCCDASRRIVCQNAMELDRGLWKTADLKDRAHEKFGKLAIVFRGSYKSDTGKLEHMLPVAASFLDNGRPWPATYEFADVVDDIDDPLEWQRIIKYYGGPELCKEELARWLRWNLLES